MSTRTIRQRVPAYEVTEGAGVTVHRSIGPGAGVRGCCRRVGFDNLHGIGPGAALLQQHTPAGCQRTVASPGGKT